MISLNTIVSVSGNKMKLFLVFLLVSLLELRGSHQNKLSKYRDDIQNPQQFLNIDRYQDKIKNTQAIRDAWQSFKDLVKKINEQIKTWTKEIKDKVLALTKVFEKRLDILEDEFKKMLEDAITTGDSVRNCLQGDKIVIEALLKEIFLNVTTCISRPQKTIDNIQKSGIFKSDDSEFSAEVQDEFNKYINTYQEDYSNDIEDEIIINNLQKMEWDASRKALDTRNMMDDTLDVIVRCVTEGLMKASSSITDESIKIIQCVKNQKLN